LAAGSREGGRDVAIHSSTHAPGDAAWSLPGMNDLQTEITIRQDLAATA
jgi:hypothetical protein